MLRFSVFREGRPVEGIDLSGAYLVGSDGVPLRAELISRKGEIVVQKRTPGSAALAIVWPVNGAGRILLQTTRLPEREAPYVLQVELLRGRLMRLDHKREEWGLYDYEGTEEVAARIDTCRDTFIHALQADTPSESARVADQALPDAIRVSEDVGRFHADVLLTRRRQNGGFGRYVLGCQVDLESPFEPYGRSIPGAIDFAALPVRWRDVEPNEQEFQWAKLDAWVDFLGKNRIPVKAGPLVSFAENNIPDWLFIWEHDFEAIRDMVYDHIRRVINRYGHYIQVWDVISGIHANSCFSFNFEQLMELTRMAAAVTKQLAPHSTAIIDLIAPWGEYYARNQRTIPPMLYADMAIQSGINFDAFGLQVFLGVGTDGMYVRDMFQISSMIDRFASLGRPLHITAVQVPSGTATDDDASWGGEASVRSGGRWHEDWSEALQSRWLREFFEIALSKPFVETVTWRDLSDGADHYLPHGGLLRRDMSPKPAYEQMRKLRARLATDHRHRANSAVKHSGPAR